MAVVDSCGDRALQDALIVEHVKLVHHVVNQVASRYPRHIDRQELWNAGACGLVEAARRFRPDLGVPFARFASLRIRGAIIDSARSRDWAGRSLRRRVREMQEETSRFEHRYGRTPDDDELASLLRVPAAELRQLRAEVGGASVLHLDHGYDDDTSLLDGLQEQTRCALPEQALCDRELAGTLRTAITCLPAVQRDVVERYYLHGEMLRDISADLGVTPARVSQICAEAVCALRAYLATVDEDVPATANQGPGKRGRASYVEDVRTRSSWRSRLEAAPDGWELSHAG